MMPSREIAEPPRRARRASARTKVVGLVRIEHGSRVGGYRIGDLSFGGMRVIGRPAQIEPKVGDRVRILLSGRRDGRAFDLDAMAEVRRVGEQDLGLAWELGNPLTAESVAYWIESAQQAYEEYTLD
jgi:hypothetical protein